MINNNDNFSYSAVEYYANAAPITFFILCFDKEYPELERIAAENLAKVDSSVLFDLKLHKKYPQFLLLIGDK